jgi:hypothetical protein
MIIEEYKGYLLVQTTSGGRAGKGYNKTASIKVMDKDQKMRFGKYFSFWKNYPKDKERAIGLAKLYIQYNLNKNKKCEKFQKEKKSPSILAKVRMAARLLLISR